MESIVFVWLNWEPACVLNLGLNTRCVPSKDMQPNIPTPQSTEMTVDGLATCFQEMWLNFSLSKQFPGAGGVHHFWFMFFLQQFDCFFFFQASRSVFGCQVFVRKWLKWVAWVVGGLCTSLRGSGTFLSPRAVMMVMMMMMMMIMMMMMMMMMMMEHNAGSAWCTMTCIWMQVL